MLFIPPPKKNNNTIHEYSCTLLTYPDSREIIMCRVAPRKVNEQAIFHIIIVLSVINRNKSMQYSSLAVVFLFRFWHHPWDEVSECPEVSSGFQIGNKDDNYPEDNLSLCLLRSSIRVIPNAMAIQVPKRKSPLPLPFDDRNLDAKSLNLQIKENKKGTLLCKRPSALFLKNTHDSINNCMIYKRSFSLRIIHCTARALHVM